MGLLIMLNGFFMLTCLPFSFYYRENDSLALTVSAIITLSCGLAIWLYCRDNKNKELKRRDGYLVVTLGWVFMSIFGSLPYFISGSIPDVTNAFLKRFQDIPLPEPPYWKISAELRQWYILKSFQKSVVTSGIEPLIK